MPVDTPTTPPLPGAPLPATHVPTHSEEAARRVAQEFESVFLSEMMGPMFEGVSTDGLGGGGVGEEMFRPMLIEQYAKALTHSGGVGIADSITRELLRMQANQAAVPTTDPSNGDPG